jgi:DNA-binding transcriptional LysR family regulator
MRNDLSIIGKVALMDLNSAWVFVRVVQAGSLSEAARQLRMPVSTVSTKISRLEKRLGVTLVRRTTRKLYLTDAGSKYFEHATRACAEIEQAESATTKELEPSGLVRITSPVEMGSTTLVDALANFSKEFPKIEVGLVLSDRYVDLAAERVDLAIRIGELKDSNLIAKKIGSTKLHAYASREYLKARGEPKRPSDLEKHACLTFVGVIGNDWELRGAGRTASVRVAGPASANSLFALHRMALRGIGIALLPDFLCTSEVESGQLKKVLPDWSADRFPVHLLTLPMNQVPKRVRVVMDYLGKNLRHVF